MGIVGVSYSKHFYCLKIILNCLGIEPGSRTNLSSPRQVHVSTSKPGLVDLYLTSSDCISFSRIDCRSKAFGLCWNFPDTIDDLGMSSGLISEGIEC